MKFPEVAEKPTLCGSASCARYFTLLRLLSILPGHN